MSILGKRKRSKSKSHPYLSGNFAPIQQQCSLTPCSYIGSIPHELAGGEYVRNGGNPVANEDLGREAHWFDGDGMLSGVAFTRKGSDIIPEFVNQYVLTDVYLSAMTTSRLRRPILPSITSLVNPLASFIRVTLVVMRTVFLYFLSWLPGLQHPIKKISVANTAIVYHDGRALATCESGPPLRVKLPSLETVGWFNGKTAENEPLKGPEEGAPLGGGGIMGFMREWTTAHPKIDPDTGEMLAFHSTFAPPYVQYSVLPSTTHPSAIPSVRALNMTVPGITSAKMMHDFGVSKAHSVIMDLPLSLDPLMLLKGKPIIHYDKEAPARFGVFPRHDPASVKWFETSACCIFHTANTWDVYNERKQLQSIDMLACRMVSAKVVYAAGNIDPPKTIELDDARSLSGDTYDDGPFLESTKLIDLEDDMDEMIPYLPASSVPGEDEQCVLHYYSFSMNDEIIAHQFALSVVPFEFPSVRPDREMIDARYVYGCTTTSSSFDAALGKAAKVDGLVKFDTHSLIARGKSQQDCNCADNRTASQVLAETAKGLTESDPIKIFRPGQLIFSQEPRFVPAANGHDEDDGFLLAYMFDEAQLPADGQAPSWSQSELWVIDAKGMQAVLARVILPQRVPYGLHGQWFSEEQIINQRPVERVRCLDLNDVPSHLTASISRSVQSGLIRLIGG